MNNDWRKIPESNVSFRRLTGYAADHLVVSE